MSYLLVPSAAGQSSLLKINDPLVGDIIVWRDVLCDGPVPNVPLADLAVIRSWYLRSHYGLPYEFIKSETLKRNDKFVEALSGGGDLILISEPGMSSQACLLQVVSESVRRGGSSRLMLAELSVPLWSATEDTILSGLNSAKVISVEVIDALVDCWGSFINGDFSEFGKAIVNPFLPWCSSESLGRLLEELPCPLTGYTGTERRAIAIASTCSNFSELFSRLVKSDPLGQLEDLNFLRMIDYLGMCGGLLAGCDGWNYANLSENEIDSLFCSRPVVGDGFPGKEIFRYWGGASGNFCRRGL